MRFAECIAGARQQRLHGDGRDTHAFGDVFDRKVLHVFHFQHPCIALRQIIEGRMHQVAFLIARQDLVIRGPGEFLGARQSGVPLLRFADLERDMPLIEQARDAADELLQKEPAAAAAHLARGLGGREEFIKA